MLTGQVLASKPVTVSLYDDTNTLFTSVAANSNGAFELNAPPGTSTVVAVASGFIGSQGSTTLTAGNTSTMPSMGLLAGDIDNNNVIDQFDALTIGMNYNTSNPAAADLNNDGIINVLDRELLAANYRKTGLLPGSDASQQKSGKETIHTGGAKKVTKARCVARSSCSLVDKAPGPVGLSGAFYFMTSSLHLRLGYRMSKGQE